MDPSSSLAMGSSSSAQTPSGPLPGTWTRLPALGLADGRVRALAVDPSGILYALVSARGVYKSTDGGNTFSKVGRPNTVNDLPTVVMPTLGLNSLGEVLVGTAPAGSGTTLEFLYRFNGATNTWEMSTVSLPLNLGGYFPPAIRRDVQGHLISSWPFRPDVMRSTDNGATWTAIPIPNAAHVPPNGPSATVKAVYGVASHPVSGELFCGTEGDQWWHSTDLGVSWAMVDEAGTSPVGQEPGQNGFLVAFNKDAEPLIGTQGKPSGDFLMRLRSDGTVVPSNTGFPVWGMVGTANATTVLREMILTEEGHNYLAMPVADGQGGALPSDLWGSVDGATWHKLGAPLVPELNALAAWGASVLVGGGTANTGVIWKFTPVVANRLPRVTTGFAPGTIPSCTITGLSLAGGATDADNDPLSFSWRARGPGVATFANANAAGTTVSFSAAGDYVLTLHATDGVRSAGAPVMVHVTGN
jgi:hypothetical protein